MTLILKSLKTIYNKNMSVEEFLWEFHHSQMLGAHQNILSVHKCMKSKCPAVHGRKFHTKPRFIVTDKAFCLPHSAQTFPISCIYAFIVRS